MSVLYPNYRHSVSSANLWRECPSAFLWRYGLRRWGKDNARIWMGKAAEAAYANALLHNLTADQAFEDAKVRFYSMSEGEDTEHAEYAAWIAKGFVEQTDPEWGRLIQHAPWRPIRVGLIAEISLKPDFVFEKALVDTKATLRMPSEPSSNHVRQISAYAKEWGLPGVLFYGSVKTEKGAPVAYRTQCLTVDQEAAEAACRGLMMDWRQIEAWNETFASVEAAMRVTPLNTDSFYWDDDQIEEANSRWEEASMKENGNGDYRN